MLYVWILTACRIQNCFHLLTLADQSAESGPAFSMQRGFTLRLRESHFLDFWSEKGCLTHMSLLVLTECCRSMSSQSGKHSQPASIVSLISLKNSWALLALKICFFLMILVMSLDKKDVVRKAPACVLSVLRVLWQIPR